MPTPPPALISAMQALPGVIVDIDRDDGCAFFGEELRRFEADAAAGAGDESYFVIESH